MAARGARAENVHYSNSRKQTVLTGHGGPRARGLLSGSCSSGVGMGRNQEQFFSWWAEKSIQVQTPAGSYAQGEHSRRRGRSGAPQAGGPLVKAVHCPGNKREPVRGGAAGGRALLPPPQHPEPQPCSSLPMASLAAGPGQHQDEAPALAARAVPTPGPELARPGRGDCPRRTSGPRAMMVT